MTFPARCHTCSNVIGGKYRYYQAKVREKRLNNNEKVTYFTHNTHHEKSIEGKVLDDIGIINMCCKIKFMTHVDVE